VENKRRSLAFSGCFLIKKVLPSSEEEGEESFWNSVHWVDVGTVTEGKSMYALRTTILVSLNPKETIQNTNVGGCITHQTEQLLPVNSDSDHVINMGRMIEDVEIELRSNIDSLYIKKTREVVDSIWTDKLGVSTQGQRHTLLLNQAILARGKKR